MAAAVMMFSAVAVSAQPGPRNGEQGGRPEMSQGQKTDREQMQKDRMEKIQAAKIAYLTEKLDLSVEEAQAFWPVYNECQKEKGESMKGVMEAQKSLKMALKEGKGDSEIDALLGKYKAAQDNMQKADEKELSRYSKVLTPTKMAKLILAEEQYRRQCFNHTQKGRGEGPARPNDSGKDQKKSKKNNK